MLVAVIVIVIAALVCAARIYLRSDFHREGMERLDRHTAATAAAADTTRQHPAQARLTLVERRAAADELRLMLTGRYGLRESRGHAVHDSTIRVWGEDGEYVGSVTAEAILVSYRTNRGTTRLGRYRGTRRAAEAIARHAGVREAA